MKVHVSKKNKKIGKVLNVSLTPVKSCVPGIPCSKECYAMQSYFQYPVVRTAWDENYILATTDMLGYFGQIHEVVQKTTKIDLFRWHVGGEILHQQYLNEMYNLAEMNPYVRFLAFTKNHSLDFNSMPKNISIVASMWFGWGNELVTLPKAWVQDKKNTESRIPSNAVECQGDCENCMKCWYLKHSGNDVYFHMH